jgi:predicted ATPase/DNA-binding SARP family transcriptional activator
MTQQQTVDRAEVGSRAVSGAIQLTPQLPLQLTSFVGRERDIGAVRQLLDGARLLTLTGAGGSGKTRLALEIAAREASAYTDGVAWVELAPVCDADIVPEAVAAAMLIREHSGRPALEALTAALREKSLLLLLDNCEHLVDACAPLAEKLLRECPRLRLLVTSREALGVPGEIAWMVPPLSLPPHGSLAPAEVARSEAGQLFVERAHDVVPGFTLSDSNAAAVAQICWRLDGLPLAIELAAARLRALSAAQVAARLDDRFRLLTGGSRTAIPRHQTLRATIDWSYTLLSPEERLLFDRLSVFDGPFSLEAAEAICACDPICADDVLELVSDLVEKSLVEALELGSAVRYRMLESVDQYGTERLAARGETGLLQRRHAEYFLAMAERAEPHLTGTERSSWLEPMKAEGDNFREALAWSRRADTELHLRLIGSLRMLWLTAGSYREALHWFRTAMELPGAAEPTRGRAAALLTAGALAAMQMENAAGRRWLEESLRLWREFGDARQASYAQLYLAATLFDVDLDAAITMLHAARSRFRSLGEAFGESIVLTALGVAMQSKGDLDGATARLEEAVGIARDLGIEHNTALPLQFLASSLSRRGELARPVALIKEALAALQRDPEYLYLSRALWALPAVLLRHGSSPEVVRLLGASEALRERIGAVLAGFDIDAYNEAVTAARAAVSADCFALAWAEGRSLDPQQAIELALGFDETGAISPVSVPHSSNAGSAAARNDAKPELCVRALGPLQIELWGQQLDPAEWRHARPRELLVHLLCHPEGRTRAQIGAALWPEASTAQVCNSFHVALHHLRKVLGRAEWVQHDRERYRINPGLRHEFDAALFETGLSDALREARAGQPAVQPLQAALSHYRGDFMAGEVVGDWHLDHRDRLRGLHVDGLLALGAALFAASRYEEAADVYVRITFNEDLHEDAYRRLMICRARTGQRARAMRHYQHLAALLREELQTEPEPATTHLFQRLQRGESI